MRHRRDGGRNSRSSSKHLSTVTGAPPSSSSARACPPPAAGRRELLNEWSRKPSRRRRPCGPSCLTDRSPGRRLIRQPREALSFSSVAVVVFPVRSFELTRRYPRRTELCLRYTDKGAITSKIKHAIKHKISPARLAQLLHNCCSPGLDGTPSLAAS